MFDNSTEDDAIVTMFALERVPVILVMLCWFPSNVWTFLVPAMALFFLSNFFYMRCYLRGPFNLDQKVFEKLGVSVKETKERKREETRNREIQSLEKERENLEDKLQVIKALEKEREKHEEDRREWDAEKKNLEDKVQVMKALEKEREDRCEWDVKKMKLENKGKLINALGKEIEKHEEDRHKWEGEKKNLEEKLSSISDSLSEEYVESGRRLEGKVQEIKEILEKERVKHEEDRHDWENEKKNLQEKISVLRDLWRSLSELYKVCRNKWEKMVKLEREKHEEDFRKWEEERNQLIDNLGAATASSQRYRELLHDLDKN